MSDPRFDLTYTGLVAPGANPEQARQRLAAVFKLSEKGTERLFSGRPVVVKRDVDVATAARFKKVFGQAGAILTITPVEARADAEAQEEVSASPDSESASVAGDSAAPSQPPEVDTTQLTLAPPGGTLEPPQSADPPQLDTSYLSLVPGDAWTLEDCEPPPTPIPEPDTSYLSLAPAEPEHDSDEITQQPIPDWIKPSR